MAVRPDSFRVGGVLSRGARSEIPEPPGHLHLRYSLVWIESLALGIARAMSAARLTYCEQRRQSGQGEHAGGGQSKNRLG